MTDTDQPLGTLLGKPACWAMLGPEGCLERLHDWLAFASGLHLPLVCNRQRGCQKGCRVAAIVPEWRTRSWLT